MRLPSGPVSILVAGACVAGLTLSGGVASAAPVPASGDRPMPPRVFAPYVGPSNDLTAVAAASGTKYLTLDFLQTPRPGSCTVSWNGDPATPVGAYAASIAALQAAGGQVVPSFGGAAADGSGTELADSCHSVKAIAAAYEHVITTYHVTRLDLDTETDSLNNYAGIDRRNKAIAMVAAWAAARGRTVQFVYTIPTNTSGIDQGGEFVLQNAVTNGAPIAIVDIMTFDYFDNLPHQMAVNTETAAQHLYNTLHRLYPDKSPSQLWGMVGVCEDIGSRGNGIDDFGAAETFTLSDARTVAGWAMSHGLAELTFWNLAEDTSPTAPYGYSHAFEPLTSSPTRRSASASVPAIGTGAGVDPQSGNLRSISCPTTMFCMAVDDYGNNGLMWNGIAWTPPVSIDPGGATVELTAVSCSSASFCAAVDGNGNALTWNGARWSVPVAVDPNGAGLRSVSCPSASFCVAVDGNGNAVTWHGFSWAAPALIDPSGAGMESVSCSSASFCAAGDWNGNAVTFDGRSWSPPALVDPSTGSKGGGLGSISCPTRSFCVATDWYGGAVTWNGKSWSAPIIFDAGGAQGLISVSCPTTSFCMAADAGGNALTWNGSSWTSAAVDVTGDGFESVSCASTFSCVAVDWNGNALAWDGRAWTSPSISCPKTAPSDAGNCTTVGRYVDGRAGVLDAVSCTATSFCVAVDENGNAVMWDGGSWSAPINVDAIAGRLTSVSCTSAAFCMAVSANGYAFGWNGTSWTVPTWSTTTPIDAGGGVLTSVSCRSTSLCAAVDGDGNALMWEGAMWSAPVSVDPRSGGLTSVSCPSTSFCAAVDANGRAVHWAGRAWSAPVSVDPAGGGLTSISCSSASSCLAVDGVGNSVSLSGAWSALTLIDPGGAPLTGVSCPTAALCVAVDWGGNRLTWNGRTWSAPAPVDVAGGGIEAASCRPASFCVAVDWNGDTVALPAGRGRSSMRSV